MHQFIDHTTALFGLLPILGCRAANIGVPMRTSVGIDIQGMTGSAGLRDAIEKHVADLKRRFSRVTQASTVKLLAKHSLRQ
jgi:hypothetical protein